MRADALVKSLFDVSKLPIRIALPDGTTLGPRAAEVAIALRTERAIEYLVAEPNDLGFARAYVSGDLDIDGDLFEFMRVQDQLRDALLSRSAVAALPTIARMRLRSPAPPAAEVRLRGRTRSLRRDRSAISHHYDIPSEFFELILGPTMAYTCAVFESHASNLDEAQAYKYELVCQKLGLRPGMRVLDIGCGWGGFLVHAALHHGVHVVGVTISEEQLAYANNNIRNAGLSELAEARLQDYREITDGPFDAVSAVGVFEHIGLSGRSPTFFDTVYALLVPTGRFLNHAISRRPGESQRLDRDGFVNRYVFPDGEAIEVGQTVSALQHAGFEVHNVESLREHYPRTLREWVARLEANWSNAVRIVGEEKARVWRLYMAGYAVHFEMLKIQHHQCLAVRPDGGDSGMPPRPDWGGRPGRSL